ncbi:MAG: type III-B CRISPR module RAMP protein Cmr6 [Candidatus Edwardsbacteria bacterium]|nr:type III-B CRISPR module RAMP protein Cmr6 [Candidatus Edwardsbacteria bacterium]
MKDNNKNNGIDNYALKLNKMARWDGDKFKFCKYAKGKPVFEVKDDFKKIDFTSIQARAESAVAALASGGWVVKTLDFTPDWRLVIGIGNESVYETGITLHHVYGCPFIPGQAAKGVTRSWIITELFGCDEGQALQDKTFCNIFGSPKMAVAAKNIKSAIGEHQGSIVFWDALPVTAPKIEVDVMNPHYGEYYQGKSWPVDYLKLNPIPFLTVGHESRYRLRLGVKPGANRKLSDLDDAVFAGIDGLTGDSTLLDVAITWCKLALSEHGIGAKSAVGYGYAAEV